MQSSIPLIEGPILSWPILIFFGLLAGYIRFRPVYNQATRLVTTQKEQVPYLVWLLLFALLTYFLSSHYVDFNDNAVDLIIHAILSWSVFALVLWALYDVLAYALKRVNIQLYTPYFGFNAALIFLIGDRILALTVFLMGLIGVSLRASFLILLLASFSWLTLRLSRQNPFPKIHFQSGLQSITAIFPLLLIIITVILISDLNSMRVMTSWDNFTHWLVIPHEMLLADKAAGLYSYTRSVAPGYPPQQVTDGAFLLFLWGDANYSDTILNTYNPLILGLGLWVCLDVCKKSGLNTWEQLAIVFVGIYVLSSLALTYRLSFYGDTRITLSMLVLVCSILFLSQENRPKNEKQTAIYIALISGCMFTLKPYAWPFALLSAGVIFLFNRNWKFLAIFVGILGASFFMEVWLFQNFVPASQTTVDGGNLGNVIKSFLQHPLNFNVDNVKQAFHQRPENIPLARALVAFSVLNFCAAIFHKDKSLKIFLVASALLFLGMVILMIAIIQLSPSFGNSLYRYMQNTSLLIIANLAVWASFLISYLSKKPVVFRTIFTSLLITSQLYLIPETQALVAYKWVHVRRNAFPYFPEHTLLSSDFVKDTIALDKNANTRILTFPFANGLAQYEYNYILARTHPTLSTVVRTIAHESTLEWLEKNGREDVRAWMHKMNMGYVYLLEPQIIFGVDMPEGLYSRAEFLTRIGAK